jgi:hypothetical protein
MSYEQLTWIDPFIYREWPVRLAHRIGRIGQNCTLNPEPRRPCMSLLKTIATILNPTWELHYGVVAGGDRTAFALIGRDAKGAVRVLARGNNLSAFFPFVAPLPVHADLGCAPVVLLCEEIGEIEPEVWIDRNEARLIPRGMTADQVLIEWVADNGRIFAATITKALHAAIIAGLHPRRCAPASLAVPLWDIAMLYSRYRSEPFLLWKIGANGSLLGLVGQGRSPNR